MNTLLIKAKEYLEENGYIVLNKVELERIIANIKLGKPPIVNKRGKIIGFVEE